MTHSEASDLGLQCLPVPWLLLVEKNQNWKEMVTFHSILSLKPF